MFARMKSVVESEGKSIKLKLYSDFVDIMIWCRWSIGNLTSKFEKVLEEDAWAVWGCHGVILGCDPTLRGRATKPYRCHSETQRLSPNSQYTVERDCKESWQFDLRSGESKRKTKTYWKSCVISLLRDQRYWRLVWALKLDFPRDKRPVWDSVERDAR